MRINNGEALDIRGTLDLASLLPGTAVIGEISKLAVLLDVAG